VISLPSAPGFRTSRLLLALSLATACDVRPVQPPAAAAQARLDEAPQEARAEPTAPEAKITTDGPAVTALSGGHVATVPLEPAWDYAWTVEGGTLTDGSGAYEATYTAGSGETVTLRCRITGPGGQATEIQARQIIVPAPVIQAFTASPPVLAEGGSGRLAWKVRDLAQLTLDPGSQDVSRQGFVEITPAATTTYRLTATNLAGAAVAREVTVSVAPLPRILAFRGEGSTRTGEPLTLRAEFSGGRAEIREGEQVLAASLESPLVVIATPAGATVYTLQVTGASGHGTQQTLTVTRQPAPAAAP
jgi:hypothetical protein